MISNKKDLILFYVLKVVPLDSSPDVVKYPKKVWSNNPQNSINSLLHLDKKRKESSKLPKIIKGNYKISILI